MPRLTAEERKKRLQAPLDTVESAYDELVDNTKSNDKFREKQLDLFYAECREIESMDFLKIYADKETFFSAAPEQELELHITSSVSYTHLTLPTKA